MKSYGIAIGFAAMLLAGSANASVVYDTITGIPAGNPVKISTASGFTPMGNHFKASSGEQIDSVTVQLFASGTAGTGNLTDAGSVLVYLVPGVSGLPGGTVQSGPPAGISLTNADYVGTILDTSVAMGTPTNITVTPSKPISLTGGNWWLVLTSGADPYNFHGTQNATDSSAKWETQTTAIALADGAVGIPPLQSNAVVAGAGGFIGYTGPNPLAPVSSVFMMQIAAPEPASLAILGVGLVGLGLKRRRKAKKSSD